MERIRAQKDQQQKMRMEEYMRRSMGEDVQQSWHMPSEPAPQMFEPEPYMGRPPPEPFAPEPFAPERGGRSSLADSSAPLVLLFDAGEPNEGVYTQTQPDGSTTILTFECPDDADRFSNLLTTKGFEMATPQPWPRDRMTSFCRTSGFGVSVVPRGSDVREFLPAQRNDNYGQARPERDSRPDQYNMHRMWLDKLMNIEPDCGNDDCIIG